MEQGTRARVYTCLSTLRMQSESSAYIYECSAADWQLAHTDHSVSHTVDQNLVKIIGKEQSKRNEGKKRRGRENEENEGRENKRGRKRRRKREK